jgi:glycyl-tRNA synthetase (class II)
MFDEKLSHIKFNNTMNSTKFHAYAREHGFIFQSEGTTSLSGHYYYGPNGKRMKNSLESLIRNQSHDVT